MISRQLIQAILEQYTLPVGGTHGARHWARVLENGRRLSKVTGARVRVVELFAVFHDSCRVNEGIDTGHGSRGAELAGKLRGVAYELDDEDFGLLLLACELHTEGHLNGDVTLQTCWDADRLDLGRVGITPRAEKLCTAEARNPRFLQWARKRGEELLVPSLISTEWRVRLPIEG